LRNYPTIIIFFGILLGCISCDSSRYYDQSVKTSADGWHSDSTIILEVEVKDTLQLFDFYINLRNNSDYRYSNFYLFLNTIFPDGAMARDTIELTLADRTGKWLGKGFGSFSDHQVKVRPDLRFPAAGKYIFEIEQAMRDTSLVGIENVGIRIEKQ
jgi:gliding motility-associated lipoprotein GldH